MRYIVALLLTLTLAPSAHAMRYGQATILSNPAVSGSVNSSGIDTQQLSLASLHFIVGAGVTGSFILQGSNQNVAVSQGADPAGYVTQWVDMVGVTASNNAASSYLYNLADIGWRWLRVKFIYGSGVGSALVLYTGKGP